MKKQLVFAFALAFALHSLTAFAQVDRSQKPEPGPAPKAAFPDYYETTLDNGLKVMVVRNAEQPLVTFRLMIKAGAEYDPNGSGEASFTTSLLTKGTKNRTAQEFAQEQDFHALSVGAGSADDYMSMSASGLVKYQDKMLDLMTDALFNPTFPEDELEKMKNQTISGLKSAEKSPGTLAGRLQITVGYNDHPYSKFQTEETVNAITRDALINFHKKYFIPNNASLAVIGDITPEDVMPVVKKYFSSWQKGEIPKRNFPEPKPIKDQKVHLVDLGKSQTQTNLQIITNGIPRNHEDYIPLSLSNSILGGGFSGRLFQNLRETHSFTYGAYSSMDARRDNGLWTASASVRRSATDSSAIEILREMRRMREEKVPEEELAMHKQYFSGTFLLSLENPGTMASRLQNIDLYSLPNDYYKNYVTNVMKVTTDKVQEIAQTYWDPENVAIAAVGDAAEIKPALERIAPVQMYDPNMNPIEDTPDLEVDIDAETLLEKHIEAMGGRDALAAIKDRTTEGTMEMSFGPQTVTGTVKRVSAYPNKQYELSVLKMGPNEMKQESWCNGSKVVSVNPMTGQQQEAEGEALASELEGNQFNDVLRLDELGYESEVSAKKVMDGKTVYALEITKKHGEETWFISADNYLRVAQSIIMGNEQQTVEVLTKYSDFKEVDGVMLPFSAEVDAGQQQVSMKITDYKHNTNPPASTFEPGS